MIGNIKPLLMIVALVDVAISCLIGIQDGILINGVMTDINW